MPSCHGFVDVQISILSPLSPLLSQVLGQKYDTV